MFLTPEYIGSLTLKTKRKALRAASNLMGVDYSRRQAGQQLELR
jgi:hypothetical protein